MLFWEGFKKKLPRSSKNKLQHIQLSDTTGTSNGTCFYKKMSFLAANTQDGFGEHGDKKYPMCTMSKNQASAMAIPVLWPEPCRKWVRWTEEKHQRGAVNLKVLDEGMVSDLLSGVL